MQDLDISDNVVMSLDKTSLRDLGVISLVQLNASRNYISYVDEEAFLGQSKLQTVDLSSNNLSIIEPKTFIRNPSLEILYLSSNQDLRLPDEGPFFVSQSLRVLKLSACNLYYLPPATFQKLPNLQELYISYNKFEILNSVQSVGSLTFLDVGHNYLTDLPSVIFTALPELIRLNLSYNRLSTLNMTAMSQLVKVNSSIDLNGNPCVCNCLMCKTVYSLCHNNNVDLDLMCSSPPEFKDKSLSNCEEGCVDFNTEIADQMEAVIMKNEYNLSIKANETYVNSHESYSFKKEFQGQNSEYGFTYVYISVVLIATNICLLIVGVFLLRRLKLYVRLSLRKGSAESDSKDYHCEYVELSCTGSSSGSRSVSRLSEVTSSAKDTQDKVTV